MILYFGDPAGAQALLARGLSLVGYLQARAEAPGLEALERRLGELPRWLNPDLQDTTLRTRLEELRPRLLVCCGYPRRIPPAILDLAPGINAHPSDLPRWRGPDPVYWTVRSGDLRTAICVHRLAPELDAGELYLREEQPVPPDATGGSLAEALEARAAELAAEVAARWLNDAPPPGRTQVGQPSWAPRPRRRHLRLDWTQPAAALDRAVRAANPLPGAFTGLFPGGEVVVLRGTPGEPPAALGDPPGSASLAGGRVWVRCGQGAYAIERVRIGHRVRRADWLSDRLPA